RPQGSRGRGGAGLDRNQRAGDRAHRPVAARRDGEPHATSASRGGRRHRAGGALPGVRRRRLRHRQDPRGRRRHRSLQPRHAPPGPLSHPTGRRGITMQLSLGMPPGPRTLERAQLAEELGYDRVWLFDSAALYEDVWIWLARLAEHTEIDLGTAVLVPNLRHVMTTASAIATVERMAPGRLACGFGTGATARWVLNKSALSWKSTRRYLEQLH